MSHCWGGHGNGYVHGVRHHLKKDQPWVSPLPSVNTQSTYLPMAVASNPTTSCLPSRHPLLQSHPRHVQRSLGSQQFCVKSRHWRGWQHRSPGVFVCSLSRRATPCLRVEACTSLSADDCWRSTVRDAGQCVPVTRIKGRTECCAYCWNVATTFEK